MRMCMADGIHERVFGPIGVEPRVSNILVPVTHSVLQGLFLSGGKSMNFQDMIFALKKFWSSQGCIIQEPYDV